MGNTFFEHVAYIITKYGPWFLQGTGMTLLMALSGTIIGFLIGLFVGVIRSVPDPPAGKANVIKRIFRRVVNAILRCYIEIFRGTPMMVQAIIVYYGLMEAFGLDLSPTVAGILVISVNTGAYMSEVVRGGIESIDRGQTEGAYAIGMTHWQAMVNIILPQAVRNILPAIGNEFVINIKDSSVLNVISVTELFFMTKSIRGALMVTYEVFLVTCAIYLALTLTVTGLLRLLEKKMDGSSSYTIHTSSTMHNASSLKAHGGDHTRHGGA